MLPPCTVPTSLCMRCPSSSTPAFNHFWMSRRMRRSAMRCSRNFTTHPWSNVWLVGTGLGAVAFAEPRRSCPFRGSGLTEPAWRLAPVTGWPGAVTRPRLPQNVACSFPALRSSEGASQRRESLQLPVREIQLWSQQWKPLLDSVERRPPNLAFPAPAAQHLAPVAFHSPMDPLQCPDVSGNAVVRIVAAKHLIEVGRLFPNRQVPYSSHPVLRVPECTSQA